MNFYQFHVGDYRGATAHLTNDEDLTYRRLLDMCYDTERPIPLDTQWVSRRLRMPVDCIKTVLQDFFIERDDGWHNERCEYVIAEYHAQAEKNRENGKKGGRPKGKNLNGNNPVGSQSVANGMPVATQLEGNQKPETRNHKPVNTFLVDGADESDGSEDGYDIPMPANDEERSLRVHMALVKPSAKKLPNCPYDSLVGMYHEVLPELPKAVTLMDPRKRALAKFWVWVFESRKSNGEPRATTSDEALTWVKSYFERARDNEFVMSNGRRTGEHKNWKSDLDYLLSEKGRVQVIEKTKEAA